MGTNNQDVFRLISQVCEWEGNSSWFVFDTTILIIGMMVNVAMLVLFVLERKSLSASQVLGLNLVVMDLIFLLTMPLNLINLSPHFNQSAGFPATVGQEEQVLLVVDAIRDALNMLNLVGCPLLMTCMCIERYLAVARPVLYLRLRKSEYRIAVSAAVWCVTLSFLLAAGIANTETTIIMLVVVFPIDCCLFFIMLACLGGVVWSLWQQSPAHTTHGKQTRCVSPQKTRALVNVLFVLVPSVISYSPVLVLPPFLISFYNGNECLDANICQLFQLTIMFPTFGVLIGPLFYISKARKLCCHRVTGKESNE